MKRTDRLEDMEHTARLDRAMRDVEKKIAELRTARKRLEKALDADEELRVERRSLPAVRLRVLPFGISPNPI